MHAYCPCVPGACASRIETCTCTCTSCTHMHMHMHMRARRTWAAVASLPVREARGALAALSLRQQREHGVHMRLQAAQQAEVARLKVGTCACTCACA